jgi:hypothetical protein
MTPVVSSPALTHTRCTTPMCDSTWPQTRRVGGASTLRQTSFSQTTRRGGDSGTNKRPSPLGDSTERRILPAQNPGPKRGLC